MKPEYMPCAAVCPNHAGCYCIRPYNHDKAGSWARPHLCKRYKEWNISDEG